MNIFSSLGGVSGDQIGGEFGERYAKHRLLGKSVSGFQMIFSSLGGASEMLHKHCKYKYEKHQFKHSVMNDQITRQKLQISILLIVEMV
jgi:hypothetical protein